MRIQIRTLGATLVLGVAVAAVPAHAFVLTGHWIGKWSCKGFDGGKFSSSQPNSADKAPSTLDITQSVGTFAAAIDGTSFTYNAVAVTDAKDPNKGEVMLLGCHLGNTLPAGQFDAEFVRASVKTKDGTFKATFKGTSIFGDAFPEVGSCKYSYKRVEQTDPQLGACP